VRDDVTRGQVARPTHNNLLCTLFRIIGNTNVRAVFGPVVVVSSWPRARRPRVSRPSVFRVFATRTTRVNRHRAHTHTYSYLYIYISSENNDMDGAPQRRPSANKTHKRRALFQITKVRKQRQGSKLRARYEIDKSYVPLSVKFPVPFGKRFDKKSARQFQIIFVVMTGKVTSEIRY